MQAAIETRRLGHVFAPVWHARSGALYGFWAEMRFPDGTSPAQAQSAARETGGAAALGELSLLSALRVSWNLPGSLLAPLEPAEDFTLSLPQGFTLRRVGSALAILDLTPAVTETAIRATAGVLREAGFALGVQFHAPQMPGRVLQWLQPELIALTAEIWASDEPSSLALGAMAREHESLLLACGVRESGQLTQLRRRDLDLATGPYLGRGAPAPVWTPARIGLSWPREAAR